jgi:TPR repeat protein
MSGIRAWERGDFAAAVKEWRPVADKGDADAQFNLGQAYRMGRGVPADARIAQSWYQKAAAQGHDRAGGNLGLMLYESGKRREALPWIRKAADQGDARAQYVMGIELTNGDLIAKDWPRAYAMMTLAAAQGLPAAARSLGQMEQFVPPAERQKGIALARQMERGTQALASAPVVTALAPAPAKKEVATAKIPSPGAKPAPQPRSRWAAEAAGALSSAPMAALPRRRRNG